MRALYFICVVHITFDATQITALLVLLHSPVGDYLTLARLNHALRLMYSIFYGIANVLSFDLVHAL